MIHGNDNRPLDGSQWEKKKRHVIRAELNKWTIYTVGDDGNKSPGSEGAFSKESSGGRSRFKNLEGHPERNCDPPWRLLKQLSHPFPLFLSFPGHSFGCTEGKKSKQKSVIPESLSPWVREQVQKKWTDLEERSGWLLAALATAIHGRSAIGQLLRTHQNEILGWLGRVCLGFSIRCWPTQ